MASIEPLYLNAEGQFQESDPLTDLLKSKGIDAGSGVLLSMGATTTLSSNFSVSGTSRVGDSSYGLTLTQSSNFLTIDTDGSNAVLDIRRAGTSRLAFSGNLAQFHSGTTVNIASTTASVSAITGAFTVAGGMGVLGASYLGGKTHLASAGLGTSGSPNLLLGSSTTGPQIQMWQVEGATTQNLYVGMGGTGFLRLDYSSSRIPTRLVSLVDGVGISGFETSLSTSTTKAPTSSAVTTAVNTALGDYVLKAGGTMSGTLVLQDAQMYSAANVAFKNSASTNISGALQWYAPDNTTLNWDFYQYYTSATNYSMHLYDNTDGGGEALEIRSGTIRQFKIGAPWDLKVLSNKAAISTVDASATFAGGVGIAGDQYLGGNLAQIRGIAYSWPAVQGTQYSILRRSDANGTLENYEPIEQWVTFTPTFNSAGLKGQMHRNGTDLWINDGVQWFKTTVTIA